MKKEDLSRSRARNELSKRYPGSHAIGGDVKLPRTCFECLTGNSPPSRTPNTGGVDSGWEAPSLEPQSYARPTAAARMEHILGHLEPGDLDSHGPTAIALYLARTYWLKNSYLEYQCLPAVDRAYTPYELRKRAPHHVRARRLRPTPPK